MKTTIRKISGLFAMAAVLLFLLPLPAEAASTLIYVSKSDIRVGDEFSVTVAGSEASNLSLHYDGTMVTLSSQGSATLDGNTLSISAKSATFTFTAKTAGSAGFVASSDKYDRSSVMLTIASATEGRAQDTQTTDSTETTDTRGSTDSQEADADTDLSQDTEADTSTDGIETASGADRGTDTTQGSDSSTTGTYDTAASTAPSFSSSDLSLGEILLDRRVIAILSVLLAVIIILVIKLLWMHFDVNEDADEDYELGGDEDSDYVQELGEEKRQKPKWRERRDEKREKERKQKAEDEDEDEEIEDDSLDDEDDDERYERLLDEGNLTMPKTHFVPEKKLHLEDLNDL